MERCGVYCRVSTELQKDNYSVERQKSDGKQFCLDNGYECELYLDVQSGSTISKRSEFSRLIHDIEDKKIDIIWVIEFSRLTRNDEEDALFLKRLFNEYNIKLFENGIQIKFDSPEDQLFYNLRSSVAAYERRKIVERMTNGQRKRIDNGDRVLPRLYGYERVGDGFKIKEQEAEVIRFIFKLASEDMTFVTIQRELLLKGYKMRFGSVNWQTGHISRILRQKAYIGQIKNSKGAYIESSMYEPIIDKETWERTQAVLRQKTTIKKNKNYRVGTFELSGLLVCRECGTKYFRKANTNKGIERGFYIHTLNSNGAFECKENLKNTTVDEMILLYLVRGLYAHNFNDTEAVLGFFESEIERLKRENELVHSKIEDLNKNLKKLENDKKKLVDAVISEIFTIDEIKDKKAEIDNQIGIIKQRINEQNLIMTSEQEMKDKLNEFAVEDNNAFVDMSQVERKELYMKRIKKITLYNRELDIEFINNVSYHIPDIYNLEEPWKGEFDMAKAYAEGNFNTED